MKCVVFLDGFTAHKAASEGDKKIFVSLCEARVKMLFVVHFFVGHAIN